METADNYVYSRLYNLNDLRDAKDEYGINLLIYVFGTKDVNILLSPGQNTADGVNATEFGKYFFK